MEKQSISVKIYNENYLLQTETDRDEVLQVAAMVDQKMQSLAANKHQTRRDLAVWAALDLAGELIELQKRYAELLAAAKER